MKWISTRLQRLEFAFNLLVLSCFVMNTVQAQGTFVETFFDVRFTGPGINESAVVLNWQRGLTATHDVPADVASGNWTINGARAHTIETDHTGNFFPLTATITVVR